MRKVYYYLYKSSFNERLFTSEYFDDISKANESRNEHIKNNPGDMVLPISEGFIESSVKFVSYTGKWPCLCSGDLHLEIEGEPVVLSHVIHSNGSVVQKVVIMLLQRVSGKLILTIYLKNIKNMPK